MNRSYRIHAAHRIHQLALTALLLAAPTATYAHGVSVSVTAGDESVSVGFATGHSSTINWSITITSGGSGSDSYTSTGAQHYGTIFTGLTNGRQVCVRVSGGGHSGTGCATPRESTPPPPPVAALTVSFAAAAYTATESGTAAQVSVTLDAASDRALVIPILTDPATGNFTLLGNLSFADGDQTATATVTATADNNFDNETVELSFGTLPNRVTAGTQATTTVTLTDAGVSASFGAPTYVATEGGASIQVSITLAEAADRALTIPLLANPASGNFTAATSVSFSTGDRSATAAVTATADDNFANETVVLSFGTLPTPVTPGTRTSTTVHLLDAGEAQLTVSFGASAYTATEDATAAVVRVQLNKPADRNLVIPLLTNPTSGNFTAPALVSFATGDRVATATVTATDDNNFDNETVDLSFGTLPDGVSRGTLSTATVTLTDAGRAPLVVSFAAAAYTATERGTAAQVSVTLNTASDRPLTIPLLANPASGDFTADTSVSFSVGARTASATVAATIDQNFATETVELSFGTLPTAVSAGSQATTTVTLADFGATDLALDASAITVTEGATAALGVSLSRSFPQNVTFQWSTRDGTATAAAGDDYTAQTTTSLIFAPGETAKTLYIPTTDDTTAEADETFTVSISTSMLPLGVRLGTTSATVTITNDDSATLALAASTAAAREGATANLTVSLSRAVSEDVTFSWSTADGTATAGDDYTAQTATSVTFTPGQTAKNLSIPTTDDTTAEADETFFVTIAAPNLPAGVTLGTAQATVTITNDDSVSLALAAAAISVTEGTPANLTVSLSNPVSEYVTFSWSTADGTAAGGDDYTAQTATSVTFTPGQTSKTLSIATTSDSTVEPPETFSVSITAPNLPTGVSLALAQATVTITNDDSASVTLAATALSITEGTAANLTVSLSNPVSENVTFSWSTADGTADAGDDYTAQPSTTVSIPAGQTAATLSVPTRDDTAVEQRETFTVTIAAPSLPTGVSLGIALTTVTITDNDTAVATLALSVSALTVTEGATVNLSVSLSRSLLETATFQWSTADGTATAGRDYTGQTATAVSFEPGETAKTLSVATTSDAALEPDETFTVSIAATALPTGVTLGTDQTTVTIQDDDDDRVSLSLTTSAVAVTEGDAANLTVQLSRAVTDTVSFTWSTADGSASAGADYTPQPVTTVSIEPGQTTQILSILTATDLTVEPDETFTVSIAPADLTSTIRLGTTLATVTIQDGDAARLAFVASAISVTEGATANLTVELSRAATETVTFSWSTADQTTVAGADYAAQPPTPVSFAPGETSKTLSVNTVADFVPEPDETFIVSLTADTLPVGVSLGIAVATVTIQDGDDNIGVPLTLRILDDQLTALEGGPPIDIEFQLSLPADRPLTIPLVSSPLHGLSTIDHPPLPDHISFEPDQDRATATVLALSDQDDDPNEALQVSLADLPAGLTIIGPETVLITFQQPGPRETLTSSVPVLLAAVARSISASGQSAVETRITRKRQQRTNHVRQRRYDSPHSPSPFAPPTDPTASSSPPPGSAAFQHPFFVENPGGRALWGGASLTQFSGNPATSSVDYQGRLWSAHVGLDLFSGAAGLVGVAFARDTTDVQYTAAHYAGGGLQAQLHSVRPYAYWQPTSRTGVWTTVAGGAGHVSATLDDTEIPTSKIRFDSFAVGSDTLLFTRAGSKLRIRADAFATQLTATGDDLPYQLRGRATQARLLLDWARDTPLPRGSDLRLQVQSGARYDRGDADRGLGAESTARIAYFAPRAGFDLSLFARTLLAHRDGYRDSGFGLQLSWDPGTLGLGWQVAVTAARGDLATGRDPAWDDPAPVATGPSAAARLEADLAYGTLLSHRHTRLTWYTNLSTDHTRDALRAGAKFHLVPTDPGAPPIQFDLGAAHTRTQNRGPDYALFLLVSLPL